MSSRLAAMSRYHGRGAAAPWWSGPGDFRNEKPAPATIEPAKVVRKSHLAGTRKRFMPGNAKIRE